MAKSILIVSSLDAKGVEAQYLRDRIAKLGGDPMILDMSLRQVGESGADITAAEVAKAAGISLTEISSSSKRAEIIEKMIEGAVVLVKKLEHEQKIDGIIGLGGATGSLMATEIMRSLCFGLPKVMVSSTASLPGLSTKYIGTSDITLIHSVVEISGLNDLLINVLERAARAICAMSEVETFQERRAESKSDRYIALTMLGPCEKCASRVRKGLEERGFQVVGFSAAGMGDRAMEEMITKRLFDGVVDLAPGGVGENLFGGMRDAGPHRMESAGRLGISQIIAPCSVNHLTISKSKYMAKDHRRRKYDLDRFRTWLRVSPVELVKIADAFAEKLNKSNGKVRVLIPLRGWSSVDVHGNPTYDPDEDYVFVDELKKRLKPEIRVQEIEANMEEPAFAEAVIEACHLFF